MTFKLNSSRVDIALYRMRLNQWINYIKVKDQFSQESQMNSRQSQESRTSNQSGVGPSTGTFQSSMFNSAVTPWFGGGSNPSMTFQTAKKRPNFASDSSEIEENTQECIQKLVHRNQQSTNFGFNEMSFDRPFGFDSDNEIKEENFESFSTAPYESNFGFNYDCVSSFMIGDDQEKQNETNRFLSQGFNGNRMEHNYPSETSLSQVFNQNQSNPLFSFQNYDEDLFQSNPYQTKKLTPIEQTQQQKKFIIYQVDSKLQYQNATSFLEPDTENKSKSPIKAKQSQSQPLESHNFRDDPEYQKLRQSIIQEVSQMSSDEWERRSPVEDLFDAKDSVNDSQNNHFSSEFKNVSQEPAEPETFSERKEVKHQSVKKESLRTSRTHFGFRKRSIQNVSDGRKPFQKIPEQEKEIQKWPKIHKKTENMCESKVDQIVFDKGVLKRKQLLPFKNEQINQELSHKSQQSNHNFQTRPSNILYQRKNNFLRSSNSGSQRKNSTQIDKTQRIGNDIGRSKKVIFKVRSKKTIENTPLETDSEQILVKEFKSQQIQPSLDEQLTQISKDKSFSKKSLFERKSKCDKGKNIQSKNVQSKPIPITNKVQIPEQLNSNSSKKDHLEKSEISFQNQIHQQNLKKPNIEPKQVKIQKQLIEETKLVKKAKFSLFNKRSSNFNQHGLFNDKQSETGMETYINFNAKDFDCKKSTASKALQDNEIRIDTKGLSQKILNINEKQKNNLLKNSNVNKFDGKEKKPKFQLNFKRFSKFGKQRQKEQKLQNSGLNSVQQETTVSMTPGSKRQQHNASKDIPSEPTIEKQKTKIFPRVTFEKKTPPKNQSKDFNIIPNEKQKKDSKVRQDTQKKKSDISIESFQTANKRSNYLIYKQEPKGSEQQGKLQHKQAKGFPSTISSQSFPSIASSTESQFIRQIQNLVNMTAAVKKNIQARKRWQEQELERSLSVERRIKENFSVDRIKELLTWKFV